jgi:predicted PolB exonuclease-like 3'-5' exonuclease
MNVLVFDIETIPDVASARRMLSLKDLDDAEVAQVMFSRRREETDGQSDFLRHYMHRVVAISSVLRRDERLSVWSLGSEESGECELLERFFDGIERFSPTLVSWNGGQFDLPVLHYRALHHGVAAGRYWETGDDDRSFRYNNYLNRYHDRHTDLMDVLAAYNVRAAAPLTEIATLLGFPGKLGMDGGDVWGRYLAGEIKAIRDYCETDVLNTYLVYLRFELMRQRLTADAYAAECDRLRAYLAAEDKAHFREFLSAWSQTSVKLDSESGRDADH